RVLVSASRARAAPPVSLPYLPPSPGLGQLAIYVVGRGRPILYPLWFYEEWARRRFPWLGGRALPPGGEAAGGGGGAGAGLGHTTARGGSGGRALPPDERIEADALVAGARAVKTPGELGLLRDA